MVGICLRSSILESRLALLAAEIIGPSLQTWSVHPSHKPWHRAGAPGGTRRLLRRVIPSVQETNIRVEEDCCRNDGLLAAWRTDRNRSEHCSKRSRPGSS